MTRVDDVERLMVQGKPNKIIAFELGVSDASIKSYVAKSLKRHNVYSRSGVIAKLLTERMAEMEREHSDTLAKLAKAREVLKSVRQQVVYLGAHTTVGVDYITSQIDAVVSEIDGAETVMTGISEIEFLRRIATLAQSDRDAALAKLAKAREALEPFAKAADSYDPDEGDGHGIAWSDFRIGSLRRARAVLSEIEETHNG